MPHAAVRCRFEWGCRLGLPGPTASPACPACYDCVQGEQPEDAIWVVLKWDGLAPLALYPSAQQTSGIGLGRLFGAQVRAVRGKAG